MYDCIRTNDISQLHEDIRTGVIAVVNMILHYPEHFLTVCKKFKIFVVVDSSVARENLTIDYFVCHRI